MTMEVIDVNYYIQVIITQLDQVRDHPFCMLTTDAQPKLDELEQLMSHGGRVIKIIDSVASEWEQVAKPYVWIKLQLMESKEIIFIRIEMVAYKCLRCGLMEVVAIVYTEELLKTHCVPSDS